jgi:hypothetical protein
VTVPFLLLCGPRGVGKSSVGYALFRRIYLTGTRAAYVDLAQIGFTEPVPGNHALAARNLAAMWPAFRAAGARCLIAVGETDTRDRYALPGMALTVCRLCAAPDTLRDRIRRRGAGEGPLLPGNDLIGVSSEELDRIADAAVREAERLARLGIGDLCVDTDGRSVDEVARSVAWTPTA